MELLGFKVDVVTETADEASVRVAIKDGKEKEEYSEETDDSKTEVMREDVLF